MAITTWTRIAAKDTATDLLDEQSAAGKAFTATIDDALAQDACKSVHYGREVEDQSNYWVFAEWNSVEDRLAYVKTQSFQSLSKSLFEFVDGTKVLSKHFTPSAGLAPPSSVFAENGLGAIEVLSLHFPGTIGDDDKAKVDQTWSEFQKLGLEHSKELRGVCGGWSVEADVPEPEGTGVGNALMLLIGWTSVEGHLDNRKTEGFDKARPLLGATGMSGLHVVHVKPLTR
ncbi:hypothetical protein LIA77_09959 [Sarocladium implicatum]|nr:hypothetical protein LIA77_09959 [Sarocladium implicatum]